MKFSPLGVLLVSIASTQAAVNGRCTGGGLAAGVGVCISTSSCSEGGGTSLTGLCPDDPENIKCCVKSPCTSSALGGGECRFTNTCTGSQYYVTGRCPGPTDYTCCAPCVTVGRREEEWDELEKRLIVC
ncbi:hypothetical protein K438DRAFT_2087080 [Mycena galopus ATCC 62051]|nr:hypothetical protein K438DRAFT_2087080 [Mycena galopus ATCC 62051]